MSFDTAKRSYAAYKGHLTIALKSFYSLMDVKPSPTSTVITKAYDRVQTRMNSVFTATENLITELQNVDSESDNMDSKKELDAVYTYCDETAAEQLKVETLYATFCAKNTVVVPGNMSATPSNSSSSSSSKPTVRLTALEPPSWNGNKADFYTWQKKFVHIMSEAKIVDELTQLCYLQNAKTLPVSFQSLITDCITMNEAWNRLEERIPRDTIKFEIISQFRKLKPLSSKKTPLILREFANEISLFSRRMADIGFSKETYSCIIMQDIYDRMDIQTTLRYRGKIELMREMGRNYSEDLDTLSDFLRSEATTLELTVGQTEIQNAPSSARKVFNAVQNPGSPVEDNESNKSVDGRRPCSLGCSISHKLIECEVYLGMPVDKRRDFIKSSSRCFVCLGLYHKATNCSRKKINWKCRNCSEAAHHWTLCTKAIEEPPRDLNPLTNPFNPKMEGGNTFQDTKSKDDVTKPKDDVMSVNNAIHSSEIEIVGNRSLKSNVVRPRDYSAVVRIEVKGDNGLWKTVTCFLDTGSNSSLVKSKLTKDLQLVGNGISQVAFGTAGGHIHYERAEEFELEIRAPGCEESYFVLATGVKKPCFDIRPISTDNLLRCEHVDQFRDKLYTEGGEVDLLLGLDYAPLIMPEKIIRSSVSPDDFPSIAVTRLGYYVYGELNKYPVDDTMTVKSVNHLNKFEEDEIKLFFYGDVLGVKPTSLCVCSNTQIAESAFIKHVTKTTRINADGRVEMMMPWKPGYPGCLPNNYHSAVGRMVRRENQLIKSGKMDHYNREISKLVERGVVKVLTTEECVKAPDESSWYLNHRMIERPDKDSTKYRIVFDSAAVYANVCLNDGFEKGPDYTNSLFRCFLQWRLHQIAVTGDMEKMFNQISMAEEDQKYHRFIWRDGNSSLPIIIYQWLRLIFGDKPSPDLATYAIRYLAELLGIEYPLGAEVLKKKTYVDDVGFSEDEKEKASQITHEVDEILKHAKLSIKSWNSNSKDIDQNSDQTVVDVLGHCWDKVKDVISVKPKSFDFESPELTKRIITSLVARLWDPIGHLLPVTIKYRIDLQKLWQQKYSWDQPIDSDLTRLWKENLSQMYVSDFAVKRCYQPSNTTGPPQLHAFSDGGDDAYGSCIFIRWPTVDGIKIVFVAAKAFVAPLKYKTTPRLKLMAAVAMARLTSEIERVLNYPFEFKRFWVDSKVVIIWLNSLSSRHKPFVATRIQEFQDSIENYKAEIRYVPSENNPADCLTKPITLEKLSSWHDGEYCEFLKLEENQWPQMINVNDEEIADMKPLLEENLADTVRKSKVRTKSRKKSKNVDREIRVLSMEKQDIEDDVEDLGNQLVKSFSSWSQLLRGLAYVKGSLSSRSFNMEMDYSPDDLHSAKMTLFHISQHSLRNDLDMTKRRFCKHNPSVDKEGLIRAKGRLAETQLPDHLKFPVLLPGEHPVVRLFAIHHHRKLLHQGYRVVLSYLVSIGIIIGGGMDLLKSIASKCLFCRIRRRQLLQQQMGSLPSFRINERKAPFTSCALDFFGYIKIRLNRNTSVKGSVLLVTCMTTRCIHLELCTTIDTSSFLRAWRRFTCIRGTHPSHVFSDGRLTFRGAVTPLVNWVQSWNEDTIKLEFNETRFDFLHGILTCSHMNGVVESIINSVRKALDASVNYYTTRILSHEEWATTVFTRLSAHLK